MRRCTQPRARKSLRSIGAFCNAFRPCCPRIVVPSSSPTRGFAPPGSSKSKPWAGTGSGAFAIAIRYSWGGEDAWIPCKALYDKATPTPKALGPARLTLSNPILCQLVLYKAKPKGRIHLNRLGKASQSAHSRKQAQAQREPWLLGTSLPGGFKQADKVVKLYALRMQIEAAFRDLKSTRFGLSLELHRTYQVERLQVLWLIATLALRVAGLLGKATELTGQHRHYQTNTVRDRVVLSTIFIGLKVIDDPRLTLRVADLLAAINCLDELIRNHCLSE